jgi:tetratricopeptide (TPR) repeat protein
MELIQSRNLAATEFGRVMYGVNVSIIKRVYPADADALPPPDLPQTHVYAKILREADRGNYTPPPAGSTDYLEYTLPFLALLNETRPERLLPVAPYLEKAQGLRPDSVLAPYFLGLIHERTGNLERANAAFTQAGNISAECYPAVMGLARVMNAAGKGTAAIRLLLELAARYPGNTSIKRQLAIDWYEAGDWDLAGPAINGLLQQDHRNGELILMKAHILAEQGQYMQAQANLDLYSSFNPITRHYLLLRAKVQDEGFRNRDLALEFLRALLRAFPDDEEALIYSAHLLLESPDSAGQNEGREILRRLLAGGSVSLEVQVLGLQDAINRESWPEARLFLMRLLAERRSARDLYSAYIVERGLGNNARALQYARELYDRDTTGDDGIAAYVSALIDSGRREEASRMIEGRLAALTGGIAKGRYYYLRSRLRANEEQTLTDLRSSLFEDPRNFNALVAMFEIYHKRKDERRAVYYLKQALAIAPDNLRLKRYEDEYAGLTAN